MFSKTYLDSFINKIINRECFKFIQNILDKYFGLCLTDLPYGINHAFQKECICKNPKHNRKGYILKDWDNTIPSPEYFVLDFTMGSGSTGVACKELNRNFIGIELNEDYFNIVKKRIFQNKIFVI